MLNFLLGLVCVLAAVAPFVLIYSLSRKHDATSANISDELNDTWLANAVRAVFFDHGPKFDEPPPRCEPTWPPTVRELAQTYADGADCAFALHDALIDAGFSHLAVDFNEENFARDGEVIRRILK